MGEDLLTDQVKPSFEVICGQGEVHPKASCAVNKTEVKLQLPQWTFSHPKTPRKRFVGAERAAPFVRHRPEQRAAPALLLPYAREAPRRQTQPMPLRRALSPAPQRSASTNFSFCRAKSEDSPRKGGPDSNKSYRGTSPS